MKLLSELIAGIEGKKLYNEKADPYIRAITYDSRQVFPGCLFVCIRGFQTDGHFFVREALARGAVAVVSERFLAMPTGIPGVLVPDSRLALAQMGAAFYGYPGRWLRVIGITGTNGKTSTAHLLEAILTGGGKKTGLLGTIANRLGAKELTASLTTPESVDLQGFLAEMVRQECSYVIMEVSSHALALSRVLETEFDIGILTNLTGDHLDFHRDFEEYRETKGLLFQQLGPGEKKAPKYAVLNADDPHCDYYRQISRVPVCTYSVKKESDFQAQEVRITPKSASFHVQGFPERIHLPLTGLFSVYNALAAIAVAVREGLPPGIIAAALREFPGVPGRFELIDEGQDFAVVVDYAHTPDGLEKVLKTAREVSRGKLITVFGCGGDRDRSKRPLMGEVAGKYSDFSIVTSDNPRTEDPVSIISDILPGLEKTGQGRYLTITDRREAIREALARAGTGDLVLIAGKGHETFQLIGGESYPFDDREVARELLRGEG